MLDALIYNVRYCINLLYKYRLIMLKFLRPKIKNNKITYPIIFNGKLVKITNKYLSSEKLEIKSNIEGIIATYVGVALCNNYVIESEEPIDKLFYNNLMKLPAIYNRQDRAMCKLNKRKFSLKINAPIIDKTPTMPNNRCITAISGGIDSIYTLVKNNNEITDLFYVIRFNIDERRKHYDWIEKVLAINSEIAKKYNKKLIICKSNLVYHIIELNNNKCPGTLWEMYTVGGGLSSIVYPLGYNKLIISGDGLGINIKRPTDYISGIFYDHLFTSSFMKIVHYDGGTRWQKIYGIYNHDPNLIRELRFCIKYSKKDGLNCGKCIKCVRTYIMLYLLGLSKYIEIKGINDNNYITYINEFTKLTSWSCFTPQINFLLKHFDPITKTTNIKCIW